MANPAPTKPSSTQHYRLDALSVRYGPALPGQHPDDSRTVLDKLAAAAEFTSSIRTLVFNILLLGILAFLTLFLFQELRKNTVSIGAIEVPEHFSDSGFSEEVISVHVYNVIQEIGRKAATAKQQTAIYRATDELDIEIPQVGVSLSSITRFLRRFLGYSQQVVSGEITCSWTASHPSAADPQITAREGCVRESFELQLRLGNELLIESPVRKLGEIGTRPGSEYFAAAAEAIVWRLDPYLLASYYYEIDKAKAMKLARLLDRRDYRDRQWAVTLIGNVESDRGNIEAAIGQYRRAIRLAGGSGAAHVAYNNLGVALANQEDSAAAIDAYMKSIEVNSEYSLAYNNLGNAYLLNNELDRAVESYQKAIELDPAEADYRHNLANALSNKEDLGGAIAEYRKAIELNPDNPNHRTMLGVALFGAGAIDHAIAAFRKAIELEPDNASHSTVLAAVLLENDDIDGAVAAYRRAISLNPQDALPYAGLGKALFNDSDIDGAVAEFRKSIDLDADFADSHEGLGTALASLGDIDGAVAAYRKAIDLLVDEQSFSKALETVRKSANLDARQERIFITLATKAEAAGDTNTARIAAQDYLRLAPSGSEADKATALLKRLERN